MDGRKNNGGVRDGAGRKPKADELKRIEMMDSICPPKEIWEEAFKLVKKGNTHAIKMWIEYRFGKPKERVDVTSNDETIGTHWDLSKLTDSQLDAILTIHEGPSTNT